MLPKAYGWIKLSGCLQFGANVIFRDNGKLVPAGWCWHRLLWGPTMVDELVLVRHANPDYSADVPDLERPLARSGLRSIQDTMTRELSLLERPAKLAVWSSPAVRARQTAEVVARALDFSPSKIEVHPELYAQDEDAFRANVLAASGCVVAVGHVPFIENVFQTLTGSKIKVGKGSAMCFSFEDDDLSHARLEWYVQGPDSTRWDTLIMVGDKLAEQAKLVQDNLEDLLKHPHDAECLHKFRVSLRTARSLVAFVRPFQKRRQNLQIDMLMSDLQHATSLLRELDGLCERVAKISRTSENLTMLAACQQARDNERARLIAYLRRRDTQRKVSEALHGMRNLKWRSGAQSTGLGQREFRAEFDQLLSSCRKGYLSCDFSDDESTHALRKRIKRLRYVAENFRPLLGDDRAQAAAEAKHAQTRLGDLCDARVNLHLIQTFDERGDFAGAELDRDAFIKAEKDRINRILSELDAERGVLAAKVREGSNEVPMGV